MVLSDFLPAEVTLLSSFIVTVYSLQPTEINNNVKIIVIEYFHIWNLAYKRKSPSNKFDEHNFNLADHHGFDLWMLC